MNDQIARYQKEAEEAESAAHKATTEADRDAYLKIAQGWRQLIALRRKEPLEPRSFAP